MAHCIHCCECYPLTESLQKGRTVLRFEFRLMCRCSHFAVEVKVSKHVSSLSSNVNGFIRIALAASVVN